MLPLPPAEAAREAAREEAREEARVRLQAVAVLESVLGTSARTPDGIKAAMRRLPLLHLHAIDRMLGLRVRETFRAYIARTRPGFVFYRWLEPLLDALQDIADGRLHRLIVQAPPRVGKSEVVSRLFPAYYLTQYPWRWCGLGSHGSELAKTLSRHARRNFINGGAAISTESASVSNWETADAGGMWAVGFEGGALGKGAHLAVIDDPTKSRKQLKTVAGREALMETYETVFYSRLEPDAALIIMAQRLHDRDLTGQLLARESDEQGDDEFDLGDRGPTEGWRLIDFPSIAERAEDRPQYPASVDVIPEWRTPGEALLPERFPIARLRKIERAMGPSGFASMHQQRPRPRSGTMFKWEWFGDPVTATHAAAYRVRYWDLAGTEGDGDYTAGVLVAFDPGARIPFIIEDVVRGQWSPARRDAQLKATADADAMKHGAQAVTQWIETEAGIAGTERMQRLVALLAGHVVYGERPTGDKAIRAEPVAGQAEVGNVRLLKGAWNAALLEELCAFLGGGEHDDQVDGLSGAVNKLTALEGEEWSESPFAVV